VANQASYAAAPGKRLWAAGFDALTVAIVFLVIGAAAEGVGRDLWRWSVFGLLFFAYHFGCLLLREGRTLGKTAVDICVISSAGRPLSLRQALVRASVRSIPFFLIDERLMYDFIGIPLTDLVGSLFLLGLVIADIMLLERSVSRETLTDRLAGSLVVNLPPLQPHRAPAVPMYSATDAEFGHPPSRPPDADRDWRKRSNSALVTDACAAALRASYSAAQRGR
jgi:uncharacterized RDD family membrane protein YckC